MGNPRKHISVKLMVGLISRDLSRFAEARRILERKFGKIDIEGPLVDFSCTGYYDKEFGAGLKRKFLSFKNLLSLEKNYRIKLYTNKIERKLSRNGRRTVNIDPGYITLAGVVLFTTKPRAHRAYISAGVFADLELVFVNKTFRPLEWTYPDYRSEEYVKFFNSAREIYSGQLK